jgi:4-oxalocrotonate tautomerase
MESAAMPVVTVQMWAGRTIAQKRNLVRAITQAMIDHAACKPDHLHVIIQDVPKDSWGRAGVLGSEEKES